MLQSLEAVSVWSSVRVDPSKQSLQDPTGVAAIETATWLGAQ